MSRLNNSKYNAELDIWRFLFSVIVVIYHSNKMKLFENSVFGYGFLATEFFFMVSGYLMAASAQRTASDNIGESTYSFIKKKIIVLYPYLISAFAVAFIGRRIFENCSLKEFLIKLFSSYSEIFLFKMSGINSAAFSNGPSWYISAMLLSMVILFPLLLKFKKTFIWVFSPVIALMIYAYLSRNFTTLNVAETWNGFVNVGILRSIAGLCLGCLCYGICEKIQESSFELTGFGKISLSAVQLGILCTILFIIQFAMNYNAKTSLNYESVFLTFLFLVIIFSKKTGIADFIPAKLSATLGEFSLPLYLNHRIFTWYVVECQPSWSPKLTVVFYILYSVIVSVLMMVLIKSLKRFNEKHNHPIKRLFVKQ